MFLCSNVLMITMSDFEKAKQEQETRRELWRQRQRDRREKIKPGPLEKLARKEYQRKLKPQTPVQALRRAAGEIREGHEGAEAVSRKPARILARLRAQRLQELRERRSREQKGNGKAEEAKEKIKKSQETAKRLKNIYRIINGTSAITLVGIIVTLLVMNAQLIFGNLLKLKIIPKLSFPEILIILFIDFVAFIAFLVIILLLIAVVAIIMKDPIIKFIADFFNLSI